MPLRLDMPTSGPSTAATTAQRLGSKYYVAKAQCFKPCEDVLVSGEALLVQASGS
jgi:hypothetical protein